MEITYNQGKCFIADEFRKSPIEIEYDVTVKPRTLGNPTSNVILERINQVLENLVWTFNITQTYIDWDGPWSVILAAA